MEVAHGSHNGEQRLLRPPNQIEFTAKFLVANPEVPPESCMASNQFGLNPNSTRIPSLLLEWTFNVAFVRVGDVPHAMIPVG